VRGTISFLKKIDTILSMSKTAIIVTIVVALGVALVFFVFGGKQMEELTMDECPAGYAVVGEACMPLKDECEIRGDGYYFDESSQECFTR